MNVKFHASSHRPSHGAWTRSHARDAGQEEIKGVPLVAPQPHLAHRALKLCWRGAYCQHAIPINGQP